MLEKVGPDATKPEAQNARALVVLNRVKDKLTGMLSYSWIRSQKMMESSIFAKTYFLDTLGRDFKPDAQLLVPEQVDKLLQQATSLEVCLLLILYSLSIYIETIMLMYLLSSIEPLPVVRWMVCILVESTSVPSLRCLLYYVHRLLNSYFYV